MLRRDLGMLRRFVIPAAILVGLFLLVSTPRVHLTLESGSRWYVLCGFALFYAGVFTAAMSGYVPLVLRYWVLVRLSGAAAVVTAVGVLLSGAATPVPAWLLVTLAGALTASCWWPPRS